MKEKKQEQLLKLLLIVNKTIFSQMIMIIYKTGLTLYLNNKSYLHKATFLVKMQEQVLMVKIVLLRQILQVKTREAIYSLERSEQESMLTLNLLLET
jgi:hypothetical protein